MLYVLLALRKQGMFAAHGDPLAGHDRVKKYKERIQNCYFGLNMDNDIMKRIKECLKCQANKDKNFQHPV
jgi:hypothetical protein